MWNFASNFTGGAAPQTYFCGQPMCRTRSCDRHTESALADLTLGLHNNTSHKENLECDKHTRLLLHTTDLGNVRDANKWKGTIKPGITKWCEAPVFVHLPSPHMMIDLAMSSQSNSALCGTQTLRPHTTIVANMAPQRRNGNWYCCCCCCCCAQCHALCPRRVEHVRAT